MSFFAWEVVWGKVLTLDLLKGRGWLVTNKCFPCHEEEKSVDHILIHYDKIYVVWNLLFSLFGLSWVLPFSVRELLRS